MTFMLIDISENDLNLLFALDLLHKQLKVLLFDSLYKGTIL